MAFKKEIPEAWKGKEDQVWTGPYSGYKERTWRVSGRDVAYPVPECPVITRHLREHALADHLSPMFETKFSREVMQDQRFQRFRGHMVIFAGQVTHWARGHYFSRVCAVAPAASRHSQGMQNPRTRHAPTTSSVFSYEMATVHLVWQSPSWLSPYPVVQPTVQASVPVAKPTGQHSTPVVPLTVPEVQPAPKEDERKSAGRVTPTVEEPVTVAAPTSLESLVVLVYQNTKKMVTVTTMENAVAQARDLFDLEEQEVVLTYLGAELTRSVKMELLPAMTELLVSVKE
ncbi:unnamed protein product [Mytilus coruscus]|uniref:Uncharacterized protein n=1 Tax=Mytilus coruscus TaxID=42192 RepID=A0A6J8DN23_MYTCO|nr:unnamed protein product [Mytilus coruscus]